MKTIRLICRVPAQLAALPVLFASVCLLHAADQGAWPAAGIAAGPLFPPPRDVYLTNYMSWDYYGSTNWGGNGTITNPWWGGFDYILTNKTIPGDTIHLGPGTFYSVGSWDGRECLKARQCLVGGYDSNPRAAAGAQGSTTVALPQAAQEAIYSAQDGITIENLTVDCATNGSAQRTVWGVYLPGNNCTLSVVTVLHSAGFLSNGGEGWAIFVGQNGSSGNTVTDCAVSGCNANSDTINGIGFSGGGTVAYNSVCMPSGVGQCINSAGANNATYLGNYCSGGHFGFYNDSYGNTNVTIVNNQFVGMTAPPGASSAYGLSMGVSETGAPEPGIINLLISGNLFQPLANPPSVGIGINDCAGPYGRDFPIENVTITNNTIEFQGTSTTWYCTALDLFTDKYPLLSPPGDPYFTNCYIGYNKIQTSVGQYYVHNRLGMQQWTVDHNTDQNGAYLCPPYWPTNETCTTYTTNRFEYPPQ